MQTTQNIFQLSPFNTSDTLSPVKNYKHQDISEEEYAELVTPISPIRLSFVMNNHSPNQYDEPVDPGKGHYEQDSDAQQFIELLQSDSEIIQFEAISSLFYAINIDNAIKVIECGGLTLLVGVLDSSHSESVKLECTKCIGKIASLSPSLRDAIITSNGLTSILHLLNSTTNDSSRCVFVEAISACFASRTRPTANVLVPLVKQIVEMLHYSKDESMINELCKAIVYLCTDNSPCIKMFIDHGVKIGLMNLLNNQSEVIVTASLRALRCLIHPKYPTTDQVSSTDIPLVNSTPRNNLYKLQGNNPNQWLVSPLIHPMNQESRGNLNEIDLLICQSVELFEATKDDADDRETEAGLGFVGQIGIRCIHCGQSPFARAQFSIVYPGSIGLMAASLRHMADKHIRICERSPIETRRRIHQLLLHNTQTDYALKAFCNIFCNNHGITNRYPQRSGIVLTKLKQTSVSSSSDFDQSTLYHPLSGTSSNTSFPTLEEGQMKSTPVLLKMKTNSGHTYMDSLDIEPNYFRDQSGLWRCRCCIFEQFVRDVAFSVWEGESKPPSWFTKQHLNYCPHVNSRNMSRNPHEFHRIDPGQEIACKPNLDGGINVNGGTTPGKVTPTDNLLSTKTSKPNTWKNDITSTVVDVNATSTRDNNIAPTYPLAYQNKDNSIRNEYTTKSELKNTGLSDIVFPQDRSLISDYLFELMCNMKRCLIEKAPNSYAGEKYGERPPDGFPGLQCIHCAGEAQPRKFFTSSVDRFCATYRRMGKHLINCKCCPAEIKDRLVLLQSTHCAQTREGHRVGHQAKFFQKLWARLHSNEKGPSSSSSGNTVSNSELEHIVMERHSNKEKQIFSTPFKLHPPPHNNGIYQYGRVHEDGESPTAISSASILLAHPDDKLWLDESECRVRKNINVFKATKEDVTYWEKSELQLAIEESQVGLRCMNCVKEGNDKIDPYGTIFPSSINEILHCVQQFQEYHFPKCPSMSEELRMELTKPNLINSTENKSPDNNTDEHYVNLAHNIGLYDVDNGVRMAPKMVSPEVPITDVTSNKTTFDETSPMKDAMISFDNDVLPNPPLEICPQDVMYHQPRSSNMDHSSPSFLLNAVSPCVGTGKRKYTNQNDYTHDKPESKKPFCPEDHYATV